MQQNLLDRAARTHTERRHLLQGRPALDLDFETAETSKGKRCWVRAVGAEDGLITLIVYGPRKTRYENDIRRFLDSVRLRLPGPDAP